MPSSKTNERRLFWTGDDPTLRKRLVRVKVSVPLQLMRAIRGCSLHGKQSISFDNVIVRRWWRLCPTYKQMKCQLLFSFDDRAHSGLGANNSVNRWVETSRRAYSCGGGGVSGGGWGDA